MNEQFGLNGVIEYYLSAIRQKTPEAKFSIGMLAFERLGSYALKYAERNGDLLVSRDVRAKKEKITKINRGSNLGLSEENINQIAKEVAYKSVGLKDRLRYIFEKFNVPYEREELNELVYARDQIIHSGAYEDVFKLPNKIDTLFNLLPTAYAYR